MIQATDVDEVEPTLSEAQSRFRGDTFGVLCSMHELRDWLGAQPSFDRESARLKAAVTEMIDRVFQAQFNAIEETCDEDGSVGVAR